MPTVTLGRTQRPRLATRWRNWQRKPKVAARAAWVTPFLAVAVVFHYETRLSHAIGILLGIGFVLFCARYPGRSLAALVVLHPFETFALGWLLGAGVPASILHLAGYWKDAITAALVIAAFRNIRRHPRHVDWIDVAGLSYIAVAVAWYLVPHLLAQQDAVIPSAVIRQLALRLDIQFVVFFLAARHCRLGREWLESIAKPVLTVGAIVALIGIYEYFFSSSWNNIAINTFHVVAYKLQVLKVGVVSTTDIEVHGTSGALSVIRIGSLLLSPLSLGSWLLVPLAIGVERLARGLARPGTYVAVGLISVALIMTQTRSAVLGGVVVIVLAARAAPGRDVTRRVRFALVAGILVFLALPVASGVGLTARSASALNGTDSSTESHIKLFTVGVDAAVKSPLGRGLGTAPAIGSRFDITGAVTAENYYLQVADELGIPAFVAFVLFVILGLRRLAKRQFDGPGGTMPSAMWTAGVGLAVGAFLLHVWADLTVATLYWSLAGAALGVIDMERVLPSAPAAPAAPGASASSPPRRQLTYA